MRDFAFYIFEHTEADPIVGRSEKAKEIFDHFEKFVTRRIEAGNPPHDAKLIIVRGYTDRRFHAYRLDEELSLEFVGLGMEFETLSRLGISHDKYLSQY